MVVRFKVILFPVLIILVGVFLFWYLTATKPVQTPVEVKEKVWLVASMPVVFEDLSPVQRLYGQVESFSLVHSAAPVSGVVEKVWVKEGQRVKAGEPLVSMSLADLDIPLQQAQADVADAKAQVALQVLLDKANKKRLAHENSVLQLKQTNVKRTVQLIQKELASQSDLDQVKEALVRQEYIVVGAELAVEEGGGKSKQIQAQLLKAKSKLTQARLNKQRGRVVAPYDLRITKVPVSEGSRVNIGTVLVSFYGLDSLELRTKLPVTILPQVQQAIKNSVTLKARYQLNNEVTLLPLSRLAGEAVTSGLDAFFTLPKALDQIRPGDLMEVDLEGERLSKVVAIPYRALYGQNKIYLIQEGRLQAQEVEVLGEVLRDGKLWALVDINSGGSNVAEGAKVCVTHLPNAMTGLKVSEVKE